MSLSKTSRSLLISQFHDHLNAENYSQAVKRQYSTLVGNFLDYCDRERLVPKAVYPKQVTEFLREQFRYYQLRHSESLTFEKWCRRYTAPVHMLLRLAHGTWPIESPPKTVIEAFHLGIVDGYDNWLGDQRGLSSLTRTKRKKHAIHFLRWLGMRADHVHLHSLCVRDIDTYVQEYCRGLRRASIESVTVCLRDILRHLHRSGHINNDLSSIVIGPRIYDHENIPAALSAEHIQRVLEVSREDHSPIGLRDFAILMLLTTYGLRAKEITRLRLEDIDWRLEIVRICHWKTGVHSELPLLKEPGEALVRYLKNARPRSVHRELFLRINAPHRPFKSGSSLNCVTNSRLKAAGIEPTGRHARAKSMLRSGVPLNVIGNVLGHTSASSTNAYLKLAVEDLRAVGLELPGGVTK